MLLYTDSFDKTDFVRFDCKSVLYIISKRMCFQKKSLTFRECTHSLFHYHKPKGNNWRGPTTIHVVTHNELIQRPLRRGSSDFLRWKWLTDHNALGSRDHKTDTLVRVWVSYLKDLLKSRESLDQQRDFKMRRHMIFSSFISVAFEIHRY